MKICLYQIATQVEITQRENDSGVYIAPQHYGQESIHIL